jgi:type IV pilus assembly protein PilB
MTSSDIGYFPRLDHSFFHEESRPHLGAVLLRSRLLRPEQLDEALVQQRESGKRLGEILIERGWLFPQDLARGLAQQFGIDYVNIQHVSVDPRAAACMSTELGMRHCAVPVRFLNDGGLLVAIADPTSESLAQIQQELDVAVSFAVAEAADILYAWDLLRRRLP